MASLIKGVSVLKGTRGKELASTTTREDSVFNGILLTDTDAVSVELAKAAKFLKDLAEVMNDKSQPAIAYAIQSLAFSIKPSAISLEAQAEYWRMKRSLTLIESGATSKTAKVTEEIKL